MRTNGFTHLHAYWVDKVHIERKALDGALRAHLDRPWPIPSLELRQSAPSNSAHKAIKLLITGGPESIRQGHSWRLSAFHFQNRASTDLSIQFSKSSSLYNLVSCQASFLGDSNKLSLFNIFNIFLQFSLPFSTSTNQITTPANAQSATRNGKPNQLLFVALIMAWIMFGPMMHEARFVIPNNPRNIFSQPLGVTSAIIVCAYAYSISRSLVLDDIRPYLSIILACRRMGWKRYMHWWP